MLSRRSSAVSIVAAAVCIITTACSSGSHNSTATTALSAGTSSATTTPSSAIPATTNPPPTTAATTTPTASGDIDPLISIEGQLDEWARAENLNGAGLVLVDREEGVVGEVYVGEFGPDRVSLIASASKMLTATVLMKLASDGVIDLDQPVAEQIEWGDQNPNITPAQLVSHTSGLVGLQPDPVYPPYLCQFLPVGTITDCAKQIFTTPDDDADIVQPETEFRYGGGQWQVAGGLAVAVSGKSWDELVDETFREPCGMTSLGYGNHWGQFNTLFDYPSEQFKADPSTLQATENPNMEGGAYVTPPDYAKALLLHLNDGRCGDTQVIDPQLIDRAHTDFLAQADLTAADEGGNWGYGYGWYTDRATGEIFDPGAFGAIAFLDLDGGTGGFLVIEGSASNQLPSSITEAVDEYLTTFDT